MCPLISTHCYIIHVVFYLQGQSFVVDGWANYKIHLEISWHFVVSMNLHRAIGVRLSLLVLYMVIHFFTWWCRSSTSIKLSFNETVSTLTNSRYTYGPYFIRCFLVDIDQLNIDVISCWNILI
jgi:hypothetical protein